MKRTEEFITSILLDQKNIIEKQMKQKTVTRKEEEKINLNSVLAQVVVGVRRSGKSTLCRNVLRKTTKVYAYVNFDHEGFKSIQIDELNIVIKILYKIYGNFEVLFLDEIQNVDSWTLFVNRLLQEGKHLLITGSNSKLLSNELATHLTGRVNKIELFPFSFEDYSIYKNLDLNDDSTYSLAMLESSFDTYLFSGGFPDVLVNNEDPFSYTQGLLDSIIKVDIENRFRIQYKPSFESITNHFLNQIPFELNSKKVADTFSLKSSHTVEKYLSYMTEAYLIIRVKKFTAKSRLRLTGEKLYTVDTSFMDKRKNGQIISSESFKLKNLVLTELIRKNPFCDIFYYRDQSYECDFVVTENFNVTECVQASYDISNEKTLKREINALLKISEVTGCNNLLLITYNTLKRIEKDGKSILALPFYIWATGKKSMFNL